MSKVSAAKASAPVMEGDLKLGKLGDFIGFRLRRIQNQLSKNFEAATQAHNLRSGLFSSLALISANPGVSQNELSQAVGLDKSVTVQIIDELEKRGFAKRERSTTDRRRHELHCSEEGREFLNELFAIMEETEDKVLHQVSGSELDLLKILLDRMYEAL